MSNSSDDPTLTETLPLLYNDDGFTVHLTLDDPHSVRITGVVRYTGNVDGNGTHEQFRDLSPEEKRAVVAQVNRRYRGKMVKI